MKPRFLYEPTLKKPPPLKYKHKNGPLAVSDARNIQNFDQKVVVENSYQDLIRAIKNGVKDSAIDFGMHWSFLPKNLDYEKQRFSFVDEEAVLELLKVWTTSTANNNTIFSDDIDLFFRALSDSYGAAENAKRSVPLV